MYAIGEDVVLLAIKRNGRAVASVGVHFALGGAELAQLAEAGRIEIDDSGHIIVLDRNDVGDLPGDAPVNATLRALGREEVPPTAREWVSGRPVTLAVTYLEYLAASGVLRVEDRKVLGISRGRRWIVVDTARVAEAKSRLDVIATSTGEVTAEQAAFAGSICVAGLTWRLYKGAAERARIEEIGTWDESDRPLDLSGPSTQDAALSTDNSPISAPQTAVWSAIRSTLDATHHAMDQYGHPGHDGGSHHSGGGSHHGGGGFHHGGGGFHHSGGGFDGGGGGGHH